jgi:Transposase domain (DUF772)
VVLSLRSIRLAGSIRWFAPGAESGQTAGLMSPPRHASDAQMDAASWCRHLVPDGSVYAFLADHRHQLFPPELFADVVRPGGGHPSVPAELVATVMVLQALEGLSDREAVSALRRDIAWKVACGLRLDDEGFHPTVLVYWRNRIRASPRHRSLRPTPASNTLPRPTPSGRYQAGDTGMEATSRPTEAGEEPHFLLRSTMMANPSLAACDSACVRRSRRPPLRSWRAWLRGRRRADS